MFVVMTKPTTELPSSNVAKSISFGLDMECENVINVSIGTLSCILL